jgi:hypothetical protein
MKLDELRTRLDSAYDTGKTDDLLALLSADDPFSEAWAEIKELQCNAQGKRRLPDPPKGCEWWFDPKTGEPVALTINHMAELPDGFLPISLIQTQQMADVYLTLLAEFATRPKT